MSNFKVMTNKFVPNFDKDILSQVSIDDCAQACMTSMTFVCNSFEYQYATSYCLLSTLHPDEKPSSIKSNIGVDLFIRKEVQLIIYMYSATITRVSCLICTNVFNDRWYVPQF
jgi:hypothetical protein